MSISGTKVLKLVPVAAGVTRLYGRYVWVVFYTRV